MSMIDRRVFLSGMAGSVLAASAAPGPVDQPGACWLDVAAPFVVFDPALQLSTEILLTATCFPGAEGYRESRHATEYEVLLYDAAGKEIRLDNSGKLEIPSLHPTLLNLQQMSGRDSFFGGAKIRVAPSPHQMPRS